MKKTTKRFLGLSISIISAGVLFISIYLLYFSTPIRFTLGENPEIIEVPYYKHLLFEWFDMKFDVHYACPEKGKAYVALKHTLPEQPDAVHIEYHPSFGLTTHIYVCADSIVFKEQSGPVPEDTTKEQSKHGERFFDMITTVDTDRDRSRKLLSEFEDMDIYHMKCIMTYMIMTLDGLGIKVRTKRNNDEFNSFSFNAAVDFDDTRYRKIALIVNREATRLKINLNRRNTDLRRPE